MKKLWLILLTSCSLNPHYTRPEICMPEEWRVPINMQNGVMTRFWQQFGDPRLDALVAEAVCCNQDLRQAISRIDQFRAQLGEAASVLFPQVDFGGVGERNKLSGSVTALPDDQETFNIFGFLFNASYLADIWGEVRSAVEAARYDYLASIKAEEIVFQQLVGAVIASYVQLLQTDQQLRISKETLLDRQIALDQARIRFDLGYTSQMPVEQAITEVQQAEVKVEQYTQAIAETENLLSLLLGRAPATIERGQLDALCLPPSVPAYAPLEIVCQRPDIRRQELKLLAANANVGVARTQFFPKLQPYGSWGSEASRWKSLLTTPAEIWSYGMTIMQEIFTGGRLTSNLRLSEAKKQEMVHAYLESILKGLEEVNNALIAHKIALEIVETQQVRVAALKEYLHLAKLRYEEGQSDYLTYLDAERHLFAGELDLMQSIGNQFSTYVQIYEALGGSWLEAASLSN